MVEQLILQMPKFLKQSFSIANDDALFDDMMQLEGRAFRDVKGRKTMQVTIADQPFFLKLHFGVGWAEIFKNLLSLKKPVLGAMTEVQAIQKLTEIGIATTPMVAYGQRGRNPATLQSFLLTKDLGEIISLDTLCANWQTEQPDPKFKQMLVVALANLAAKLHGAGLCHRDFYLCHFVIQKHTFKAGKLELVLIDLHRMLQGEPPNGAQVMKDIAALIFSAKDYGFGAEDWALFKQHYLPQSDVFWRKVERRAEKLYQKFHSQKFQTRLSLEKANVK